MWGNGVHDTPLYFLKANLMVGIITFLFPLLKPPKPIKTKHVPEEPGHTAKPVLS